MAQYSKQHNKEMCRKVANLELSKNSVWVMVRVCRDGVLHALRRLTFIKIGAVYYRKYRIISIESFTSHRLTAVLQNSVQYFVKVERFGGSF